MTVAALGPNVESLLAETLELILPLRVERIGAGGSNLTFLVTDAGERRIVVRRPPIGTRLATAHDMRREWDILMAMYVAADSPSSTVGVPVPAPLAWLPVAKTLSDADAYAMAFVEGRVLRSGLDGAALSNNEAERVTSAFVDTLASLHAIDPVAVGLGQLGRADGYIERQLARWMRQFEAARVRELPALVRIHTQLTRTIPKPQRPGAIVHGDYRFENMVLGSDGRVAGVLDWELCTRGEPVADLFWAMQYWGGPDGGYCILDDPPTAGGNFPDQAAVLLAYERVTRLDLCDARWYRAFTAWKQAALVEGVYARRLAGVTAGAPTGPVEAIAARVDRLLEAAGEWLPPSGLNG